MLTAKITAKLKLLFNSDVPQKRYLQ